MNLRTSDGKRKTKMAFVCPVDTAQRTISTGGRDATRGASKNAGPMPREALALSPMSTPIMAEKVADPWWGDLETVQLRDVAARATEVTGHELPPGVLRKLTHQGHVHPIRAGRGWGPVLVDREEATRVLELCIMSILAGIAVFVLFRAYEKQPQAIRAAAEEIARGAARQSGMT